ncbi:MAG TPA: right-handed parallel beta-helix repeat-containing protein [Phenylobacterium sp.]
MTTTIIKTYNDLWYAVQSASDGDIFQLSPGEYEQLNFANNHFSPNGILITSEFEDNQASAHGIKLDTCSGFQFTKLKVTLNGPYDVGCMVDMSSDVLFSELTIFSTTGVNEGQGVRINDTTGATVTLCDIGHVGSGVLNSGCTNITISKNNLHDLQIDGILTGGSRQVTVAENQICDLYPQAGDHPDAIQFAADSRTGAAGDQVIVRDNDIKRGAGEILQGIFIENTNNMTISGNAMAGTMDNGISLITVDTALIDPNFVQGFTDCRSIIAVRGSTSVTVTNNTANNISNGPEENPGFVADGNTPIGYAEVGDYSDMDAWRKEHPAGGAPAPTTQACVACMYYLAVDSSGGLCRRFPPDHSQPWGSWPAVKTTDWCGEFLAGTSPGGPLGRGEEHEPKHHRPRNHHRGEGQKGDHRPGHRAVRQR